MFQRLTFLALALLLDTVILSAQQPQSAPTYIHETFRANSELVLVPVLVRNKSGAHIPNLTAEVFTLQQDGTKQNIAVFQEITDAAPEVAQTAYGKDEFGNQGTSEKPGQLTIIAIDAINSGGIDQARLRQELLAYLDRMGNRNGGVSLVAMTPRGLRVLNDFSANPKSLAEAVRRMKPTVSMAPISSPGADLMRPSLSGTLGMKTGGDVERWERALDQFGTQLYLENTGRRLQNDARRQVTLDEITTLAKSLANYPGRKTLIWATVGMPFTDDVFRGPSAQSAMPTAPSSIPTVTPGPGGTSSGSGGSGAPGGSSGSGGSGGSGASSGSSGGSTNVATSEMRPPQLGMSTAAMDALTTNLDVSGVNRSIAAFEKAWKVLNDANVAVYPVDIRGLTVGTGDFSSAETGDSLIAKERNQNRYNYQDQQASMNNMASNTGGRPCVGRNHFADCFLEADEDAGSYYLLGYYVDRSKTKPGWHKLKVKVAQKGISLRSRTGFLVPDLKDEKPAEKKAEIVAALVNPLPFAGIPFRGQWLEQVSNGEKKTAPFALKLQPGSFLLDENDKYRIYLDVIAVASKPDGTLAGQSNKVIDLHPNPTALVEIQSQGILFSDNLALPPGEYSVRFVIRDNISGRIGSATSELKVE